MLKREEIMQDWDKWREQIANGNAGSGPRDAFESLLDKYDEIVNELKDALEFYADPNSYFGIMFFTDHPCGDFSEDVSEDHGFNHYDRPMPGKHARKIIEKVEKEFDNA